MEEVLDLLNKNSGALQVVFAAVVALSTLVYALLTWKLVSETKRLREAQTEPEIFVRVQPREEWINWVDMVIENIGSGPAYNVRFGVRPDFEYSQGKFLAQLGFVNKGLRHLGPKQKIQFFLTSMVEDFEKKTDNPFHMTVNFENKLGRSYERTFTIDFSEWVGLGQLGEPPLHRIAKNLESIQKDINRLCSGSSKLKTVAYTKQQVEQETQQQLDRFKRRKQGDSEAGNK